MGVNVGQNDAASITVYRLGIVFQMIYSPVCDAQATNTIHRTSGFGSNFSIFGILFASVGNSFKMNSKS